MTSKLEIHVGGTLKDMKRRVVDAVERGDGGLRAEYDEIRTQIAL